MRGINHTDPADWRGPALAANEGDWIHRFSAQDIAEIENAVRSARAKGCEIATLTKEDFPLPNVASRLGSARDALENAHGIYVLRGIPTEGRTKDDLRFLFWGLGLHLGTPVCQSYKGDYLGDVRDFGESGQGRLYTSNKGGGFHVDTCDVVGLFVLRTAKSGGLSQIASTVAIHNEIARTRPDLLDILFEPFVWNSSVPGAEPPYFSQPVFSERNGRLSCMYLPSKIRRAEKMGVSKLTQKQNEALDLIMTLAEDPKFQLAMMFEPGDIQLLNNHVCVHARTGFEDYPEPDRKRHLLRLWLSVENSRALDPALIPTYGDVRPGVVRAGIGNECGIRIYRSSEELGD